LPYDQLIWQLVDRARVSWPHPTEEDGLLQQLTKRRPESALEGEITDHVGGEKHDRAGRQRQLPQRHPFEEDPGQQQTWAYVSRLRIRTRDLRSTSMSRALLAGSKPAPASISRVAAGDNRRPLMANRKHLGSRK